MRKHLRYIVVFAFLAVLLSSVAWAQYYRVQQQNQKFVGRLRAEGVTILAGATTVSGPATFSGTLTHKKRILTSTALSLTSPTLTFSVASAGELIVLTSDANTTGVCPIGGTLYETIVILAGTGSNTMRFDDGSSMTLGATLLDSGTTATVGFTLTEGQGDILSLLCVSSDGDEWTRINSDN